ncbi:MAG: hypothetical protein IJI22_00130 [Bacilli bacterium]|nr:hypothetical protein [Bacilli bacterium]
MKIIKVEDTIEGFKQLIDSRMNGEYAVWEFGEFITTTDDVPDNYDSLEFSEVVRQMKVKALERSEKLGLDKGISENNKTI